MGLPWSGSPHTEQSLPRVDKDEELNMFELESCVPEIELWNHLIFSGKPVIKRFCLAFWLQGLQVVGIRNFE